MANGFAFQVNYSGLPILERRLLIIRRCVGIQFVLYLQHRFSSEQTSQT